MKSSPSLNRLSSQSVLRRAGKKGSAKRLQSMQGFSLLELILAMALTSLLVLGVMQVYRFVAESWTQSDLTITRTEQEFLGFYLLRRLIGENTLPVEWPREVGEAQVLDSNLEFNQVSARVSTFVGEKDKLQFVAKLPTANAESLGLYLYTLERRSDKTQVKPALVLSYRSIDWTSLENTLAGEEKVEVILENVVDFSLSYYGKPSAASEESVDQDASEVGEVAWQSDWLAQPSLPEAIRLTITRPSLDKQIAEGEEVAGGLPLLSWEDMTIRLAHRHLR